MDGWTGGAWTGVSAGPPPPERPYRRFAAFLRRASPKFSLLMPRCCDRLFLQELCGRYVVISCLFMFSCGRRFFEPLVERGAVTGNFRKVDWGLLGLSGGAGSDAAGLGSQPIVWGS